MMSILKKPLIDIVINPIKVNKTKIFTQIFYKSFFCIYLYLNIFLQENLSQKVINNY